MIKMKDILNEGSDWVLLKSDGNNMAIDSYSGFIFNYKKLNREYKPDTKEWEKIYNKLSLQDKKIVDNVLKDIKENKLSESNLKVKGHEFHAYNVGYGKIYAGPDGILGDNGIFIDWSVIDFLRRKFK